MEIGNYFQVQEFHEQEISIMLLEVGFWDVKIVPLQFGVSVQNLGSLGYPQESVGRTIGHVFLAAGDKK